MEVSKRWKKASENYKWFARNYSNASFSDAAALAMYDYESRGVGNVNHYDVIDGYVNGFALGKHLQDLQLAMWYEDLCRPFMLSKYELLTDPELEPIKQLLIEQFGDIDIGEDEDLGNQIPDMTVLYKHIGKYLT